MEQRIEQFREKCRQAGLKITPQRLAVYQALVSTSEHPSAEYVCKMVKPIMANISLDTVNRTLKTLVDIGAAFVVEGSGDVARYDGGLDSHQHFKCIKCKKVVDFRYEQFENITLPSDVLQNFIIKRATLYAEGICQDCQEVEKSKQKN